MAENYKIQTDSSRERNQLLLTKAQIGFLLGYPKISEYELKIRQQKLDEFDLQNFYSLGSKQLSDFQILGLGYVGLVVLVDQNQHEYALKIRRTDAPKADLFLEAQALQKANMHGIAPKIMQANSDFILMEYVKGEAFIEWLKQAIARQNKSVIINVLESLLQQAFQLDQIGLDRGDMNCITNDVIITAQNQPVLIDFSSASGDRQQKNLTSLVQGLFWGSIVAEHLRPLFPYCNQDYLIPFLRRYKKESNLISFESLKQAILFPSSKDYR